jgi:GTP-binding protein
MFVDHIVIHAKAGDGGRGCVAFRRETFVPKGGPSGGDGGKGGDVILEASPHVADFRDFFYQPHLRAKRGGHGLGSNCTGKSAPDLVVPVPPGTVVYRVPTHLVQTSSNRTEEDTAEKMDEFSAGDDEAGTEKIERSNMRIKKINPRTMPLELVADLASVGDRVVLCRGGRGGLGNQHFATPMQQAPTYAQPGEEGESGSFYLELKSIADVGFVGFPNAGKSSLLGALTAAKPLVGVYPFTTLHPHVGVLELEDFSRLTFADIPGLIAGASEGVGLGHDFLRHIERTKMLLFVLDMAGTDNRDPSEDLKVLERELAAYSPDLLRRPQLVAANKMDHPDAQIFFPEFLKKFPQKKVVPISAKSGEGLGELVQAVRETLNSCAKA